MMIKLNNIIKRYGNTLAVDNLSLTINEGEIFGLLGPNGAGKSTTNKMLIGLLKPNAGTITINGLDVQQHGIETRKYLSIVPQELAIYEHITARQNVHFFGRLSGLKGKKLQDHVTSALQFTELSEHEHTKVSQFSGGMKRRLNIACAIVNKPKIIIMDEPTVGIDPQSRAHILESIRTLNKQGTTIIYTSHYMSEVESLCQRIGIIDHGRLISLGTPTEIKALIPHQEKLVIEAQDISFAVVDEIKKLYDVTNAYYNNGKLEVQTAYSENVVLDALTILAKYKIPLQKIELETITLEDVFLSLTGRTLRD